MEFLYEFGLFLAKAAVIIIFFLVIIAGLKSASKDGGVGGKGELKIRNLSRELRKQSRKLRSALLGKTEQKAYEKELKKSDKKDTPVKERKMFLIEFKGNMHAEQVEGLREEVSAILALAKPDDEVLIQLESPGGVVHGYGLAASQISRLTKADIKVTVSVDKVAASGGYMMACVADKIVSAPFAIVGSIGVVAQMPNFHKLLKKNHIDVELHTAGDFKRTLTTMGENTDEGREKFKEMLEETHVLFKDWVAENRPDLDIDKVATGEHWYGQKAVELGLVDEIGTSDDLIIEFAKEYELLKVEYQIKQSVSEKLGVAASTAITAAFSRLYSYAFLSNK